MIRYTHRYAHTSTGEPFFVRHNFTQPPSNLSTATGAKPPLTSISSIFDALNIPFLSPSPTGHARRGITRSVARTDPMQACYCNIMPSVFACTTKTRGRFLT
ncbi:hypothetical protein V8C42DRAFT_314574 [Trichoderma barbatum]